MLSTDKIPVLVLNWNGTKDTINCIRHLQKQTYRNFYIYLMDNGSDLLDRELLMLELKSHNNIHFVQYDTNLGFVKAHNRAMAEIIKHSRAEGLVLLNNDAFASDIFIEKLIESAKSANAGMVVSKMLNYFNDKRIDNVGHCLLNTGEILPIDSAKLDKNYASNAKNIGPCAGACYYSLAMLKDIGLFDEYFHTGYEDAEFGMRATLMGYDSVFANEAVVRHKISQSINKVKNLSYVKQTQTNIFYSYFKLMPSFIIIINLPFIIMKYLIVIVLDIVFFRWFFLKVITGSIKDCFGKERNNIYNARKEFHSNHKINLTNLEILKKMKFFLWFDIQRFYTLMIKGEKSYFESFAENRSKKE